MPVPGPQENAGVSSTGARRTGGSDIATEAVRRGGAPPARWSWRAGPGRNHPRGPGGPGRIDRPGTIIRKRGQRAVPRGGTRERAGAGGGRAGRLTGVRRPRLVIRRRGSAIGRGDSCRGSLKGVGGLSIPAGDHRAAWNDDGSVYGSRRSLKGAGGSRSLPRIPGRPGSMMGRWTGAGNRLRGLAGFDRSR